MVVLTKLQKLVSSNQLLALSLGVFAVSMLAYGLTMWMYIWQDDHALFFKLQHIDEGSGVLGTGIYDRNSAYRFVVVPLYPLYLLFKTNPAGYFFFGIVAYALAGLAVYFLCRSLTKSQKIASAAALIFASGYIGAETLWRIFNSIHTTHTIIATCLTLLAYHKFIELKLSRRKILFYVLSVLLFVYTVETGYVRAHGVVLFIVALEVFFNLHLVKSLFRLIPFAAIFYWFYIHNVVATKKAGWLFESLWTDQRFDLLLVPLKIVQNIFVPDYLEVPLVLFVLAMSFIMWKARGRVLYFSAAIAFANLAVYFINTPDQVLPSTHRYLSLSLIGISIFTAVAMEKLVKNPKSYIWFTVGIIALHLISVNREQHKIIQERSEPAKKFYSTLKKEIPTLPIGSAIYFDVQDYPKSQSEFANFFGVGSMPDMAAIAVQYGVDRYDLYLPQTFNELLTLLKNGDTANDKVFTFHYNSSKGLVNTTSQTRASLFGETETLEVDNPMFANIPSTSPRLLQLTVSPGLVSPEVSDKNKVENLGAYVSYLNSREQYYKSAKITTRSEWKYSEVKYINDQDEKTTWMGHRGRWHFEEQEYVQIDLGKPMSIGAMRRTNGAKSRTPISYIYYCSQDGSNWTEIIKGQKQPHLDFEETVDTFPQTTCRYVKMDIKETISDDSPQIAEIEVVEEKYKALNFPTADKLSQNPLGFAQTPEEKLAVMNYLRQKGADAQLCLHARDYLSPKCYALKLPVSAPSYHELIIDPQGEVVDKIEVKSISGLEVRINKLQAKTLPFDELNKRGYIFEHSQN